MRRRRSTFLSAVAVVVALFLIGASSAGVKARLGDEAKQVTLMAVGPGGPAAPPPAAQPQPQPQPRPRPQPTVKLEALARKAMTEAQRRGADISFTVLDRQNGGVVSGGDPAAFPIASVTKLFIADDLLMQITQNKAKLSSQDRKGLEAMLRSSDDFPADDFWARGGGNAIIARVVARYNLSTTTAPYNGDWWNTMSTTADLVRYYDMLLDGTGGLPPGQADIIVSNLAASTPLGADGYPQRFGIPDGLFAEPVAVKQGWMCCWIPDNQVHLSTGVVGPDRRYVIAVASMQPVDEATARNTLTQALKTMFPGGRIQS
jgi:hypothetical protein